MFKETYGNQISTTGTPGNTRQSEINSGGINDVILL